MREHVPSINAIIDSITVRMEATHDQSEHEALSEALAVIESYVFRERRTVSLIERVLSRLGGNNTAQMKGGDAQ